MGGINWLAVALSSTLAVVIGIVWYGPLFGSGSAAASERRGASPMASLAGGLGLQAVSAVMLGHAYARIGETTLEAKPWLYWMQAGGIGVAFIIPALWISYLHQKLSLRDALVDGGLWVAVYLAAGTLFWALS